MATPIKHAVCSASSSGRWLNCTASPRFEENFPERSTSDSEKGRLAHSFCEQYGKLAFGQITKRKFTNAIKKLKENELFSESMLDTADFYSQYLNEKAMTFSSPPNIGFEVEVDFSNYVPEGFGTCDCLMLGGDTLHITDYKNGRGVVVSAENNSQMRLYALGALNKYSMLYDIKKVSMAIVQPNVSEEISEECITTEELRAWGDSIKPLAYRAYAGLGEFKPGSWCRFCRGYAQCKARAENHTAFEDFKDFAIEGRMSEADKEAFTKAKMNGENVPGVLTDAEIADLLVRGADLVSWYNALKDYATEAILDGKEIPGWKVVEGKSIRKFVDEKAAFDILRGIGYTDSELYKSEAKSLAVLEKEVGIKRFAELMSGQIDRPAGKPTLVIESDKREPYHPAIADFAKITQGET